MEDCMVTSLFTRGSQWTGDYVMEFRDLINLSPDEVEHRPESEEARFSFLKGGYVEDRHPLGHPRIKF